MMTLKKEKYQKLSFHLFMFTIFFLAAAASLSFAYFSEYMGDLVPCPLCLYQRYPYWIMLGLSLLGLFFSHQKKIRFTLYLLITLSIAINIGISFYHFGMEQAWWTDREICQSKLNNDDDDDLDEMRKQILATPVADCAIVQWSLFGISMSGYNFLFSIFLFLLSSFGFYHWRKEK